MKCSLYIPVFNEREGLRRTLRALIPEKGHHEVFVVDRGSQDGSEEVAKAHDWVRWIASDKGTLAESLNQAAENGDGEILMFLQAGAYPVRGWAEAIEKHFNQNADAGHFQLVEADPASKLAAGLRKLALKAGQQLIGGPAGLSGLVVKRSTFNDVHGFIPVPDFEWLAFANRIKEAGGKVVPIPHDVQRAPLPGSRQADPWEDLLDDLRAAWRYRKTDSFDPVRCRRKSSAAILLGHDLFDEPEVDEYFAYAREALLTFNLERLQSYRGAHKVVYMGGNATTKFLDRPSGVQVCPHIRTALPKRFQNLFQQLETDGIDGLLLVRSTAKDITHARLKQISEQSGDAPCTLVPDAEGKEWLALWINGPAFDLFRNWDLDLSIAKLENAFFDAGLELNIVNPVARLKTNHDARAMYYAGLIDRLPA